MKKIFLVITLLLSSISLAGIYKWSDENGKVHYSDSPPSKSLGTQLPSADSASRPAPAADNSKVDTLTDKERERRLYANVKLKSVLSNSVSQASLYTLFNQMINACASKQPSAYWALLPTQMRVAIILKAPIKEQQEVFTLNCDYVKKANNAIDGKAENGVHTVEQEPNRKDNGVNVTYWYIHTKQNKLVSRLKIVFENDQLRLNSL